MKNITWRNIEPQKTRANFARLADRQFDQAFTGLSNLVDSAQTTRDQNTQNIRQAAQAELVDQVAQLDSLAALDQFDVPTTYLGSPVNRKQIRDALSQRKQALRSDQREAEQHAQRDAEAAILNLGSVAALDDYQLPTHVNGQRVNTGQLELLRTSQRNKYKAYETEQFNDTVMGLVSQHVGANSELEAIQGLNHSLDVANIQGGDRLIAINILREHYKGYGGLTEDQQLSLNEYGAALDREYYQANQELLSQRDFLAKNHPEFSPLHEFNHFKTTGDAIDNYTSQLDKGANLTKFTMNYRGNARKRIVKAADSIIQSQLGKDQDLSTIHPSIIAAALANTGAENERFREDVFKAQFRRALDAYMRWESDSHLLNHFNDQVHAAEQDYLQQKQRKLQERKKTLKQSHNIRRSRE